MSTEAGDDRSGDTGQEPVPESDPSTATDPPATSDPAGPVAEKAAGPEAGSAVEQESEPSREAEPASAADRLAEFERRADLSRRRTRRRWVGRILIGVGVLVLLACGWVAWRVYEAYDYLNNAAAEVSTLQNEIRSLDTVDLDQVTGTIARLQVQSAGAVSATSDPLYKLAAQLPWAGPNLYAVAEIAGTVDGLATETAPRLLEVATALKPSSFAPKDGTIDISPVVAAAPVLASADAAVQASSDRVRAIPRDDLVGPVARAVTQLDTKLQTLGRTTAAAARIGRLAPVMLGADGPRTYLVVFQNLAEPRATGGIFGSFALLTMDNGRFRLTGQGSSTRDLGVFIPPVPLPPSLPVALYQQLPGTYPTDTNLTPDFPTAAALMSQMYQLRTGTTVDGVLAIDPVAMSYLISHLKPIDIGRGLEVDSENLTEVLLSQAYRLFPETPDAAARDVFLSRATGAVFEAVTGSGTNGADLLKGVIRGAGERRIMLWSAHPNEQKDLLAAPVAGDFPAKAVPTPQFGMFRNDGTGAKLGYYASGSVQLSSAGCTAQGRRSVTLKMSISYAKPAGKVPDYVLGLQTAGPGVLRTNVLIFAPGDAQFGAVTIDGKPAPATSVVGGAQLIDNVTVDLKPGQTAVLQATLDLPDGAAFTAKPVITPGIENWPVTGATVPTCAG